MSKDNKLEKNGTTRRSLLKTAVIGSGGAVFGLPALANKASAEVRTISNDHLQLFFRDSKAVGAFTMQTSDGRDLLFGTGNPDTSYLTIQIDGQNYITHTSEMASEIGNAKSMDNLVVQGTPKVSDDGNSVTTKWKIDSMLVTQTITLKGKASEFKVTVKNQGSQPRTVNIRYLFDYQVNVQDGSPILVNNQVMTSETRYESPTFSQWETYDSRRNPDLTGLATVDTQPDIVDFVEWEDAVTQPYEYEHAGDMETDEGNKFFTEGTTNSPESDSAGLLYWEIGGVDPSSSRSVVTYYGTGSPSVTDLGPIKTALDKYQTAVDNHLTDFVDLKANAYAQVYKKFGEDFSDNLTNYYGRRANPSSNQNIPPTSELPVDTSVERKLNQVVDEIEPGRAEMLYLFTDELFRDVDRNTSVEAMAQVIAEHFMGTSQNQQYPLKIRGSTLQELRDQFNSTFDEKQQTLLQQLRNDTPSQERLDALKRAIDKKKNEVERLSKADERDLTRLTTAAVEERGMKTHGSVITKGDAALVAGLVAFPFDGPFGEIGVSVGLGAKALLAGAGASLFGAFTLSGAESSVWKSITSSELFWYLTATGRGSPKWQKEQVQQEALQRVLENLVKLVEDGGSAALDAVTRKVTIADLTVSDIDSENVTVVDDTQMARGTGKVTVANPSSENSVTPIFVIESSGVALVGLNGLTYDGYGQILFPSTDQMPEIGPGETATIEFEYLVPLDVFSGQYEVTVTVKANSLTVHEAKSTAIFKTTSGVSSQASSRIVNQGSVTEGESPSQTRSLSDDTSRATYHLSYPGSNLDIHLQDPAGNHVGLNYQSGEVEHEIPNVTYSGPDRGIGSETISVADPAPEYIVEIVALETDADGSDYSVNEMTAPSLPATLEMSPAELPVKVSAGDTESTTLTIDEATGAGDLEGVTLSASEFQHKEADATISASNVTFERNQFDVKAGNFTTTTVTVSVPGDVQSGTYIGTITGKAPESKDEISVTITVGTDYEIIGHRFCRSVKNENHRRGRGHSHSHDCVDETNSFSSSDESAYLWTKYGNVTTEVVHRVEWYAPSGEQYHRFEFRIPNPESEGLERWEDYPVWSWIDIAGTQAATMPGTWQAQVYANDTHIATREFTIE
ncbi:hypothetical protein [Halorussus sp. MSC15.2]|uniref:COG1470 family protein n=1 Tax=Halorussus sp. MSC15.2 TaxID=2283638 RepID=UPI0013D1887F|nr:hypothetical protein [Halorussus sp. MSC15.2]NEU59233.1 hypothetical protein [Halorussus sp. MSC15.2]